MNLVKIGIAVGHFTVVSVLLLGVIGAYQRGKLIWYGDDVVQVTFERQTLQNMVSQGWLMPREFEIPQVTKSRSRTAP